MLASRVSAVLSRARSCRIHPGSRSMASSRLALGGPAQPYVVGKPPGGRPLDGMRATVFGAVLGAGIAYAYAQYSLAPKYAANVQLMDRTIDAVQQRSSEVAEEFTHVARLEDMLSTAIEELANKDEMAAHRAGLLRESDDLYAKIFELRQALWSVDNDVHNTLRKHDFTPPPDAAVALEQGPRLV